MVTATEGSLQSPWDRVNRAWRLRRLGAAGTWRPERGSWPIKDCPRGLQRDSLILWSVPLAPLRFHRLSALTRDRGNNYNTTRTIPIICLGRLCSYTVRPPHFLCLFYHRQERERDRPPKRASFTASTASTASFQPRLTLWLNAPYRRHMVPQLSGRCYWLQEGPDRNKDNKASVETKHCISSLKLFVTQARNCFMLLQGAIEPSTSMCNRPMLLV